jgi:DNA-binding response OmpR family regulator
VDDEPDFGRMVARSLIQAGYRVDGASSAREAMDLQGRHLYDLAVVDLKMPDMTGLELLQYLKAHDKRIFVMIMTAYGSIQVGIEALRKGACDYLSKPFKLSALRAKVKDNLSRRRRYLEEMSARLGGDLLDD